MRKFDFSEVWRVEVFDAGSWTFLGWSSSYERALGLVTMGRKLGIVARFREA